MPVRGPVPWATVRWYTALPTAAVTTGASGMKDMGRVMGAAQAAVAGRADGSRVAAEVRRQLG